MAFKLGRKRDDLAGTSMLSLGQDACWLTVENIGDGSNPTFLWGDGCPCRKHKDAEKGRDYEDNAGLH